MCGIIEESREAATAEHNSGWAPKGHSDEQDGIKGVYPINAIDCVTQWEWVATCEKISEAFLLPVIRARLDGFPCWILGFHPDNGSEYINHQVTRMLDKLRVEFTKSRPRHSNDHGGGGNEKRGGDPQARRALSRGAELAYVINASMNMIRALRNARCSFGTDCDYVTECLYEKSLNKRSALRILRQRKKIAADWLRPVKVITEWGNGQEIT